MPNNWKTYKLSDLFKLRKTSLKPKDFKNQKYIGLEHISQETFMLNGIGNAKDVSSNKYSFEKGDILYGKIRSYFQKVFQVDFTGICSTDILVLHSKNEGLFSQDYLYQIAKTQDFTNRAIETSSGTKMPRADWNSMGKVELQIPPLPEQKAIASILSTIDDQIENNLAMNKTLEEMAMALYKHWFVDFGPFQEGNFVESELGEIPEGWEVKAFLDLFDLLSGGTPKTKVEEYWNGSIPWVSAKDIGSSNNVFINETEKLVTELGVKKSATKLLPEDTIILVARGSVGKFGMITREMTMNQSCYGVYSKCNYSQPLTFLLISSLISHFLSVAYGSVFDTITTSTFKNINVILPPDHVMKEIKYKIDPLFEQMKHNIIENQTLIAQRDALLPKLVSG